MCCWSCIFYLALSCNRCQYTCSGYIGYYMIFYYDYHVKSCWLSSSWSSLLPSLSYFRYHIIFSVWLCFNYWKQPTKQTNKQTNKQTKPKHETSFHGIGFKKKPVCSEDQTPHCVPKLSALEVPKKKIVRGSPRREVVGNHFNQYHLVMYEPDYL